MFLPGKHNIYNALIAITTALYYGAKPESIQNFFKSYRGIWRRLEVIHNNKYTIIDDCAHNPGSYQAVFNTIKNLRYDKLIILNSLRGNRGIDINIENAKTISKWIPKLNNCLLITTNCRDVVKNNDKVSNEEEKEFLNILNQKNINYIHFQNLTPALKSVVKRIKSNYLILLLGPHAMDEAGSLILKMIN
jgi:UDP-N-acetylmuramoyl-L-alanyl-D-glutamate--2,6-diaminopimelate ligase